MPGSWRRPRDSARRLASELPAAVCLVSGGAAKLRRYAAAYGKQPRLSIRQRSDALLYDLNYRPQSPEIHECNP